VLDGNGEPETVLLHNTQWVEVSDLDITNAAKPGTNNRRGIHVSLENYGTGDHYVLRNLYVHDIMGLDDKGNDNGDDGSAGILFSVTGKERRTHFNDVLIENNIVRTVDREGIYFYSAWSDRNADWIPATGVVVRGNSLSDIGGDGIVITVADGTLVERNALHGFQLRSAHPNAGMWPYNADNSVFQYNEVSGGKGTNDAMAYDVDDMTSGTVFQYNYSHDNEGGFFLVCAEKGVKDAVIRFNISQNDRFRGIETCHYSGGQVTGVRFLHNTIYVGDEIDQVVVNITGAARCDIAFDNNIVVKEGKGTARFQLTGGSALVASHNVLHNVEDAPADPGGMTTDPLLARGGTAKDLTDAGQAYALEPGSPAVHAGKKLPDAGDKDFAGNPLPDATPDIGALNGSSAQK
jgi:hypothetical protein